MSLILNLQPMRDSYRTRPQRQNSGTVAQQVERPVEGRGVRGSIPCGPTTGSVAERQLHLVVIQADECPSKVRVLPGPPSTLNAPP